MKGGKLIFFPKSTEAETCKKANLLTLKRIDKQCGLRQSMFARTYEIRNGYQKSGRYPIFQTSFFLKKKNDKMGYLPSFTDR